MTKSAEIGTEVPLLAHGMTWEEMAVGSVFRTSARTITETDLVNFITACGFTEPLFWDARVASEANYSGRLVPGALTFCYAEGLVLQTNALHGTGLAFMHMELDIKAPVFAGDTIDVLVEVTESRSSSRPNRGVVTTRNTIRNQRDEIVATYTPTRLIKGRDWALANQETT